MVTVDRSALVPHAAATLYALVADVERYPEFLPWCSGASVRRLEGGSVSATLDVRFRGFRQSFTTRNQNRPAESITMVLERGPFRSLNGVWRFTPLGESASRVELHLEYDFSSALLERIAGPAFEYMAGTFVDAFVRRAASLPAGGVP